MEYSAFVDALFGITRGLSVIYISDQNSVLIYLYALITGETDIFSNMEKGTFAMFCLCFAIFTMVIAFASPYWVESFEKADNKFVKCGLWEFCFNDYTFYKDYNGKRFLGCWYIFSASSRPLWEWLSPRKYTSAYIPTVCLLIRTPGYYLDKIITCKKYIHFQEEYRMLTHARTISVQNNVDNAVFYLLFM